MTQAGMMLGTAAYMSPEQARGKVVDRRADIWACGAVLFEILTGLTWFDRSGQALGTVGEADRSLSQRKVSPDGRRVTVQRAVAGNTDLWLLEGGRTSRSTFDAATDIRPTCRVSGTGHARRRLVRSARVLRRGTQRRILHGGHREARRPRGADHQPVRGVHAGVAAA